MKKSGITVAALLIAVATSTPAQVPIDEKYLVGTWVGEWVFHGQDPRGPSAVTNRDTLTFRSDGKFVRLIKAADNPDAPTVWQEGTYTITGDTIVIRGTYDGGARSGETTSITLKARGETLEASINPPSGRISFTYNRASTAAQVSTDEKYLVGTWVGEWVFHGQDRAGRPSAVTQRDTLTFRSDGKFVRAIRPADNPNAPTVRQEGTYTITGDTIWIRGTYDGGERSGQTTSIALKARGETLEASINPPAGRLSFTYSRASTASAGGAVGSAQQRPTQPDLSFPKEARELGFFSPLDMGIWKPRGQGPFPALIIVHTCAGLRQQIGYWRKEAVRRGYVVFVIDSFSSRGSPSCNPLPPVPAPRGVKDVFDAAEHLKTFPFVDKSKIGLLGLSWGAMVGLRSASPGFRAQAGLTAVPLGAIVSLYPACYLPPLGSATAGIEILHPDLTTPTLVLMGGQDNEVPPQECISRLEPLKDRGAPVEWHVFPNATHCWDCSDQHNQRWNPPWAGGRSVVYLYDARVTDESAERAFGFLSQRLKLESKN